MRIAFISGLRGNQPTLRAVLADIAVRRAAVTYDAESAARHAAANSRADWARVLSTGHAPMRLPGLMP